MRISRPAVSRPAAPATSPRLNFRKFVPQNVALLEGDRIKMTGTIGKTFVHFWRDGASGKFLMVRNEEDTQTPIAKAQLKELTSALAAFRKKNPNLGGNAMKVEAYTAAQAMIEAASH